jgi:DNA-binding CsgD family transcriptional regulator
VQSILSKLGVNSCVAAVALARKAAAGAPVLRVLR